MVAAMLGKPLMEWQQYVVDVLLEIDPETGELWYTDWTLTVPRQSGKSVLILAKASHRCLATKFFGGDQTVAYAAQTKLKATNKFERDYGRAIKHGQRRIKAKARIGNQVDIQYPNGSLFGVEAGTEKAGHGDTLDEAYVDEAFAQPDNRLETAFEPAMSTRRNHQLGAVSTAGWEDASPYLLPKVQAGRKLVQSGEDAHSAFFEWSAPDDADPGDEAVWLACMPALHRPTCGPDCKLHTVSLKTIRGFYDKAVRENKLSEFRRSFLNQWLRKPREGEETALGNWAACARKGVTQPEPVGLAVGVSRNRDAASIGATGFLDDGVPVVALVERHEGTDWLAVRAAELSRKYGLEVVVDVGSNAGENTAKAIEEHDGRVKRVRLPEYVQACDDIYDRVRDKQVAHTDDPLLNRQVEDTRWRPVGDARRVFGRKLSEGDIDGTEAVTLALWGATNAPTYDLLDSFR